MTFLMAFLCFGCGSLMFSYWLGLIAQKDVKTVGDGNPGAANLWKVAGYRYGVAGVALDFLKGYLPMLLLRHYESSNAMIFLALAPILGHAFSPFLKFKGGKAIAVTFGVWSGLTDFKASLVYAIILAVIKATVQLFQNGRAFSANTDSLQVVLGMCFLGIYLLIGGYTAAIGWVWVGNTVILIYKGFFSKTNK